MKVHHVRKDGHYHHGAKITVISAIKPGDPTLSLNAHGSIERP
jgi:hypothetical protein